MQVIWDWYSWRTGKLPLSWYFSFQVKFLKFIQSIIVCKFSFWNCIIYLEDLRVSCATCELLHWLFTVLLLWKYTVGFFIFWNKIFFALGRPGTYAVEEVSTTYRRCIVVVPCYYYFSLEVIQYFIQIHFWGLKEHDHACWLLNFLTTIVPCFFPCIFLCTLFPQFPAIWKTFLSWDLMASQSINSEQWHRCFSSGLYQWDASHRTITDRKWGETNQSHHTGSPAQSILVCYVAPSHDIILILTLCYIDL